MIELLIFALVVFGISWGVGHAHASYPFRKKLPFVLIQLLECFGCSSWHIGWIAYAAGFAPHELSRWWIAAFFSSASSLVLARLSGMIDSAD